MVLIGVSAVAADSVGMIRRASTLTLAAVTMITTSSAAGKAASIEARIAAMLNDATSPAAVKPKFTTLL